MKIGVIGCGYLGAVHAACMTKLGHDVVGFDVDAVADHVFVTFEGAFLLCRATGDTVHLGAQLRVLRQLLESLLTPGSTTP